MTKQHGFTLIELMVATAITGILAATAYPSFQGPLLKARRIDGLTALLQLQMRQESWRSDHASYASSSELKLGASPLGYYQLSVSVATAAGFSVVAQASGAQASDSACKVLQINMADGNANFVSGPDEHTTNATAANKRCWNL